MAPLPRFECLDCGLAVDEPCFGSQCELRPLQHASNRIPDADPARALLKFGAPVHASGDSL